MSEYYMVYTACPVEASDKLAEAVYKTGLVACVHVHAPHKTIYRWGWKNELFREEENTILFKTRKECYRQLEKAILDFHPFHCPAILAVPVEQGYKDHLEWLERETGGKGRKNQQSA